MKWAARPRDGHVGHQVEVGACGCDQQREEHVVLSFKSEDAVSAQRREVACVVRHLARRTLELQMHLQTGSSVENSFLRRRRCHDATLLEGCLVTIGTSW